MLSQLKSSTIPLIPLPKDYVLLPGTTQQIPILNRADIAALLAHIYGVATSARSHVAITIGCVPLRSHLLSPDGNQLIEGPDGHDQQELATPDPGRATSEDLFGYGTIAKVSGVQDRIQGELSLVVEGLQRFKIEKVTQESPYFEADVSTLKEEIADASHGSIVEQFSHLKQLSRELLALIRLSSILPKARSSTLSPVLARRLELYISSKKDVKDAGSLADFLVHVMESSNVEKLRMLAAATLEERLERAIDTLQSQISSLQGNARILTLTASMPSNNLDIDRLRKLQQELLAKRGLNLPSGSQIGNSNSNGSSDEEPNELEELKKRLDEAQLSPEAQKVANRELQRLKKMNPAQAEHQVCRNYLETIADIPWTRMTADSLDSETLARARKQLDDDHYGLEKIKKRLLEHLAVLRLKQAANDRLESQVKALQEAKTTPDNAGDASAEPTPGSSRDVVQILERKRLVDKSPILLLVGPPGTGKTSLAKSIASALGRKFHRISLGGVRDEAEIRGHRRTYVAAMPGLIVNGLKKVGVANPVILLDEIDKIGMSNFNGDPSAAMLEVLDPEQNHTFTDHYLNIPIDLSKVLFIATANTLDTIVAPLLDRMETISLPGYTTLEKRSIATRHLLPKQIISNGLTDDDVQLNSEVLDKLITSYTRESGVRNLEREIGAICRFKAVEFAEAQDRDTLQSYDAVIHPDDLETILGIEKFEEEIADTTAKPGVVTGLVAYSFGGQGSILFVEVVDVPGSGCVRLTGKLGDVLKESVEVALTWVKAHAFQLSLTNAPSDDIMESRNIHVHCPSGAVPKDGPSAGLAHAVALISLFSGKAVPPTLAMTGEVSLRGKVTPVGGIKEKLIGALRAGVKTVLLPIGNTKEARDLPQEVKDGLEIIHVSHIGEALRHVWPDSQWPGFEKWSEIESHL